MLGLISVKNVKVGELLCKPPRNGPNLLDIRSLILTSIVGAIYSFYIVQSWNQKNSLSNNVVCCPLKRLFLLNFEPLLRKPALQCRHELPVRLECWCFLGMKQCLLTFASGVWYWSTKTFLENMKAGNRQKQGPRDQADWWCLLSYVPFLPLKPAVFPKFRTHYLRFAGDSVRSQRQVFDLLLTMFFLKMENNEVY